MPSVLYNIFKKIFFCFFKTQDEDDEDEDEMGIEMPTMNGSLNGHVKVWIILNRFFEIYFNFYLFYY